MSASGIVSFTVNSPPPPATSVTFGGIGVLNAPVAPGTTICSITVSPSNWVGTLALGGANASEFVINPGSMGLAGYIAVGSSPLAAGSFSVSVTATP